MPETKSVNVKRLLYWNNSDVELRKGFDKGVEIVENYDLIIEIADVNRDKALRSPC